MFILRKRIKRVKKMQIFDKSFGLLEKGLDAYSTRAKALANNIANVNTPNYKREDIKFENTLAAALDENSRFEGKVTQKGHFEISSIPSLDNVKAEVIKEESVFMKNDGNGVDIEKEQSELTKNNLRYQFATTRISSGFNLLKGVIKGR